MGKARAKAGSEVATVTEWLSIHCIEALSLPLALKLFPEPTDTSQTLAQPQAKPWASSPLSLASKPSIPSLSLWHELA